MIINDNILEGRLAIPEKFVKQYGDTLSDRVIIKVPDGTMWKMELSKGDNYDAWLEKGWKEFLKHYSLRHGSMLLFKYEHNSSFLVFIFGTNFLQIQYARTPDFGGKSNVSKVGRVSQALEAADKFTSVNPWFKVVLKFSSQMLNVFIPTEFVREHMDRNSHKVFLKVEGGACCWPVTLNIYWKKRTAKLCAGLFLFERDNGLKANDVCVFELVGSDKFNVHIFRT